MGKGADGEVGEVAVEGLAAALPPLPLGSVVAEAPPVFSIEGF